MGQWNSGSNPDTKTIVGNCPRGYSRALFSTQFISMSHTKYLYFSNIPFNKKEINSTLLAY